jgi:predicted nuclease of restriction endonuclease-like RecB superfamily
LRQGTRSCVVGNVGSYTGLPKIKTRNKFETKLVKQAQGSSFKVEYESERIPYVIEGKYIPDIIIHSTPKIYIEAKGHFRPEAKRKMVAVKKLHPDLDIRLVFYSYNKKYVRWADKHGFPYAIGNIPDEWL